MAMCLAPKQFSEVIVLIYFTSSNVLEFNTLYTAIDTFQFSLLSF